MTSASSLSDLVDSAARLSDADTGDRLTGAAALGDELEDQLATAEALLEISRRVVSVASDFECQCLYGASRVGERLSAAAVADRANGLHLYSRSGERSVSERVLIVDGILATGASINRSARDIALQGSTPVAAAVVLDAMGHERAHLTTDIVDLNNY